jgi:4-hydroxybenzoyl-CoA reductase subunit alpha
VESYEPRGPFGAKEIGEGSTLPVLGAIANAIHDATGVRVTRTPVSPDRLVALLAANGTDHPGTGSRKEG